MKRLVTIITAVLLTVFFSSAALAQRDARVRIINTSPPPISFIWTSPASSDYYGDTDLLDAQGIHLIEPRRSAIIDFNVRDARNSCVQDVKAEGADGRVWKWRMNVCEVASWTLDP